MSFSLLKSDLSFKKHVLVKRNNRARRMSLRMDPQDRVFYLVLPRGVSLRRAHRFAEQHEDWMQEQLQDLAPPIPFIDGARVPLFGKKTTIRIYYDKNLRTTSITLENNKLIVWTNKKDPSARIERYLKTLAKEKITELARKKALRIEKSIRNVYVRDTKTRWGSCSSDNNLSFSWRLIFAPYLSLDYVVAHEVAHLKHLDHSKAFWAVCRRLSKSYLEGKYWMQAHGHELMRYG